MHRFKDISVSLLVLFVFILCIEVMCVYWHEQELYDIDPIPALNYNDRRAVTVPEFKKILIEHVHASKKPKPSVAKIAKESVKGAMRGALVGLLLNGIEGGITGAVVFAIISPMITGVEHLL